MAGQGPVPDMVQGRPVSTRASSLVSTQSLEVGNIATQASNVLGFQKLPRRFLQHIQDLLAARGVTDGGQF